MTLPTLSMRYPAALLHSALLVLATSTASTTARAQPSVRELEQYMRAVRTNPSIPLPASSLADRKNDATLIDVLIRFSSDTSLAVREKAYDAARRIGQQSTTSATRVRAVTLVARGLKEKDSGVEGSAIRGLTGFRTEDFAAEVKGTIGTLITPTTPHLGELVRLAGYLQLTEHIDKVRAIVSSSAPSSAKTGARFALARMGDRTMTAFIVSRLGRLSINDDVVYQVVPDLVYTRQPEIFKFLETIIRSDEPNCGSPDPDSNKKMPWAYRVIERIAPVIQDFPVAVDASGDLDVKSYEDALVQVRAWLAANPSYALRTDTY